MYDGDDQRGGAADGDAPPLGAKRRRREDEPRKRTKTEEVKRSRADTFDMAGMLRAVSEAHANGASQGRQGFDSVQDALSKAFDRIEAKDALIAALHLRIADLTSNNPTVALMHVHAEQGKLDAEARKIELENKDRDSARKWDSVREIVPKIARDFGPKAGPILAIAAEKFGIRVPPEPSTAAPTPQPVPDPPGTADARRVFAKMVHDGAEKSSVVVAVLQDYVEQHCGEDFDAFAVYLAAMAGPAPAGPAGGA